MLSRKLGHRLDKPLGPLVKLFPPMGISPNMLTVAGAIVNTIAAVMIAYGELLWGGALVLTGGVFDLLDGALARVAGKQTRFGSLLDSTFDRYSDIIPICGLLLHYTDWYRQGDIRVGSILLCCVVILGSFLVPYVRAKAESLVERMDVGIAERAERVIIFGGGLIIGLDVGALWTLAVLTTLTVIQRLLYVRAQLREKSRQAELHPAQERGAYLSQGERQAVAESTRLGGAP